jgi:hypothetical protein
MAVLATWRSGYAAVCKTVYPGSIPGVASTREINHLAVIAERKIRRKKEGWWLAGETDSGITLLVFVTLVASGSNRAAMRMARHETQLRRHWNSAAVHMSSRAGARRARLRKAR